MAKAQSTCIYCGRLFNPMIGEGDHVLPHGFGDFDGAIIFRGACPRCNGDLSPLEEELLRTAPEAVLRRFVGAATNRRGKPIGWKAASGVRPPRFVIRHGDHEELVEGDSTVGGQVRPVDHLTVVLKNGRNWHIRLFPTMSAEALRRKLEQMKITEAETARIHWHSDDANAETYKALLSEVWPEMRCEELESTEAGIHRVPISIECRFTMRYYRAIAKIAFHYFLANSRCGFTGHEERFAPIRTFIMNGGELDEFFNNQKPQVRLPVGVLADGTALLPARWMHLMCCFESYESAVVAIYLLFGPERPPTPHFVTVLHRTSSVITPSYQYGHAYIYGDSSLGDDRRAFVEPVRIGQILP